MGPLEAVVLGAVQGATEFLPVSSSGHLVLASRVLGVTEPGLLVAAGLHLGTLVAVVWFTRKEIAGLLRGGARETGGRRLLLAVALGTLPAAVVGAALLPVADWLFGSSRVVGGGLLVTAALLWHSRGAGLGHKTTPGPLDALLVGAAQAVALVPGVSRSGATIWAGMRRGVTRAEAARFSFLLSIPATMGAGVAELLLRPSPGPAGGALVLVLGAGVAALAGWGALHILYHVVVKGSLWLFAPYCLVVAVATMLMSHG